MEGFLVLIAVLALFGAFLGPVLGVAALRMQKRYQCRIREMETRIARLQQELGDWKASPGGIPGGGTGRPRRP